MKGSELLQVFFFFDRNFLSRFQWWSGVWFRVFSPKLLEGFFESKESRGQWKSESVSSPVDVRVHGRQPRFSKKDHISVAHVHDIELSEHESSINLDCKMAVVHDGVFRDLSIGSSDRERGGEAMGFYSMLSDKDPMDECGSCTAIDNSSGLQ